MRITKGKTSRARGANIQSGRFSGVSNMTVGGSTGRCLEFQQADGTRIMVLMTDTEFDRVQVAMSVLPRLTRTVDVE